MNKNLELTNAFMPGIYQNINEKKEYYIYIHIPFCNQKCTFCSIPTCIEDKITYEYLNYVLSELQKSLIRVQSKCIRGIHIGGGTPSILSLAQIEELVSSIYKILNNNDIEIVFEAHPQSLSYDKIDYLSKNPNILLNIGIQTLSEAQLMRINRKMTTDDIISKIEYAMCKMKNNVGIDLIAGLPEASCELILRDLSMVNEIGISYISLYPLRIEAGSILHKYSFDYKKEISRKEELKLVMKKATHFLKEQGYSQLSLYEWGKGERCAYGYANHQRNGGEWIGIGTGAYSYFQGMLWVNVPTISTSSESTHQLCCIQDIKSKIVWDLSFAIRMGMLNVHTLAFRYGNLLCDKISKIMELFVASGYAYYIDGDSIQITSDGIVDLDKLEEMIKKVILLDENRL